MTVAKAKATAAEKSAYKAGDFSMSTCASPPYTYYITNMALDLKSNVFFYINAIRNTLGLSGDNVPDDHDESEKLVIYNRLSNLNEATLHHDRTATPVPLEFGLNVLPIKSAESGEYVMVDNVLEQGENFNQQIQDALLIILSVQGVDKYTIKPIIEETQS